MRHRTTRQVGVAFVAAVLAVSVGAIGAFGAGGPSVPDQSTTTESGADGPSIAIDCADEQVRVDAPDDYEYSLTVASVDISAGGLGTQSATSGTYAGDHTASFDADGFAFAFVTDASTGETVAATYENCAVAEETTERETTTADDSDAPSIQIDCNESEVRVTAPEDESYGLEVGSVAVTPGSVDSSNVATSEEGNATVTFEGDLVSVYVTDGDEVVASAVAYCGDVSRDESAGNETTPEGNASGETTESETVS